MIVKKVQIYNLCQKCGEEAYVKFNMVNTNFTIGYPKGLEEFKEIALKNNSNNYSENYCEFYN